MPVFAYNPIQLVQAGQNAILDNIYCCQKGYVFHGNQSGIVTLRGIVNNPTSGFAEYRVEAKANIALPETATEVAPIALALTQNGEVIQPTRAIVTPAAVDEYSAVSTFWVFRVPRGCCFDVALENASEVTETGLAPAINVQNVVMTVTRTA